MVFTASCQNTETDYIIEDEIEFTFKALDNIEYIFGTGKIMNIVYPWDEIEENVKVFGRLITLFGDPLQITDDLENAYIYVILATHISGRTHILSAYSGPSGPAIGGGREDGIEEAAEALKRYILQAEPSDFVYEGYYMDFSLRIYMSVEDGRANYSERQLTEAEHRQVMERWFPEIF